MSKNYRNIRVKAGSFYVSHKEANDKTTTVETKNGTFYHELISTLEGKFGHVKIEDGKFGKSIRFTIEDNDFYNVVDFPIKDTYGVDAFAKSFIQHMGNLEAGTVYTVFTNNKFKNKNGYLYKNFMFGTKDAEGKFEKVAWTIQPDDPPQMIKKENKLGEVSYDSTATDDFFIDALMEGMEKFEYVAPEAATPSTEEKPKAAAKKTATSKKEVVEDEREDLPF